MKKNILAVVLVLAMTTMSIAPTFAEDTVETSVATERAKGDKKTQNEGKSKYLEKANVIKTQIDEIQKEIDNYKTYNESVKKVYNEISKAYKETKTLNISEDNFKKAKELRKTIANKSDNEKTKRDKEAVKNLVSAQKYEEAVNKLNEILTNKKIQLEFYENANTIWKQIEELIK